MVKSLLIYLNVQFKFDYHKQEGVIWENLERMMIN